MTEYSPVDLLVRNAEQIARRAHEGQFRRDGLTPYVVHPRAVAARVAGDVVAEAVAWLHDVLEDTDETADTLAAAGVPTQVIDSVKRLTKTKGAEYQAYLAIIRKDPIARKVKMADMLANLSDNPTERQIRKYAKGLLILLDNDG
ncbi:MAG: hypothetical protein AAF586_03885 [Planctomycetota bacterium]